MSSPVYPLFACFSLGKGCCDLAILPEKVLIVLYFTLVFIDGLAGRVHVLSATSTGSFPLLHVWFFSCWFLFLLPFFLHLP